jgi:hypothetical protein
LNGGGIIWIVDESLLHHKVQGSVAQWLLPSEFGLLDKEKLGDAVEEGLPRKQHCRCIFELHWREGIPGFWSGVERTDGVDIYDRRIETELESLGEGGVLVVREGRVEGSRDIELRCNLIDKERIQRPETNQLVPGCVGNATVNGVLVMADIPEWLEAI